MAPDHIAEQELIDISRLQRWIYESKINEIITRCDNGFNGDTGTGTTDGSGFEDQGVDRPFNAKD